jgi:hypothetical protein
VSDEHRGRLDAVNRDHSEYRPGMARRKLCTKVACREQNVCIGMAQLASQTIRPQPSPVLEPLHAKFDGSSESCSDLITPAQPIRGD